MSKTEDKIYHIFLSNKIKCIREKTFQNLYNGKLRFDFYLPERNILVEYDSEIHFTKIPKFHKDRHDFIHAQENDRIKNSYALAHKIPLYRIPFWEIQNIHTVDDILSKKFLVHSKWHNDQVYRDYMRGRAQKNCLRT